MPLKETIHTDYLLIGAGIMSATLANLLHELTPEKSITVLEKLDKAGQESSDTWNNAGTGHSALCEFNYTPRGKDGKIDIKKALTIYEQFEITKQYWSYLLKKGTLKDVKSFLNQVPHVSFVSGEADVAFLQERYSKLSKHHFFKPMQYSEDREVIKQWMPLVINGRDENEKVAATFANWGTDVNYGALTIEILDNLSTQENVKIHTQHEVLKLKRNEANHWVVKVRNLVTGKKLRYEAPFVFIGAGGASLLLLEKSGIPEGKIYGGFPVSGEWLKCTNKEVIEQHYTKVYGKAKVGAPPMSVPHLDTRYTDEGKSLLFGPYAGFSSKFLKSGSYLDLINSISFDNVLPMIKAGWDNKDLTKYLIGQVLQSQDDRIQALRDYYPDVKAEDWQLEVAGQRVQVIKKDVKKGGVLEFGTEVVTSADGSLSALLGASPGASTAAPIMLKLLNTCFHELMKQPNIKAKLEEIFPSYGMSLKDDEQLYISLHQKIDETLGIIH